MNPEEFERYRRNLLVDGFGVAGQQRLAEAHICVVGAGGLGSATLLYLTAAGIGSIHLIENDTVTLSNLQRQTLYTTNDLQRSKAEAAAERLHQLNPHCTIHWTADRLTADNAATLLNGGEIIVDCCDNYATRYTIDDYCAQHHTPMVYGTAEQWGGQVALFHARQNSSYRTLYPQRPTQKAEVGVLSPVVGVIGSLQALETIKWLTEAPHTLDGKLLTFDGHTMQCSIYEI